MTNSNTATTATYLTAPINLWGNTTRIHSLCHNCILKSRSSFSSQVLHTASEYYSLILQSNCVIRKVEMEGTTSESLLEYMSLWSDDRIAGLPSSLLPWGYCLRIALSLFLITYYSKLLLQLALLFITYFILYSYSILHLFLLYNWRS